MTVTKEGSEIVAWHLLYQFIANVPVEHADF